MLDLNQIAFFDFVEHARRQLSVVDVALIILDGGFPNLSLSFAADFRIVFRYNVAQAASWATSNCQGVLCQDFCNSNVSVLKWVVFLHKLEAIEARMRCYATYLFQFYGRKI